MAIDIGNTPTGTPPTSGEKLQIRTAIGLGKAVLSDKTGLGASSVEITNVVALSQADYDAIVTKNATTLYHII